MRSYEWRNGPFYGVGLKVYDLLAGKLGLGPSNMLSREETLARIPTLEPEGLRGGVIYYDGQFDDARLAVNLAQTVAELGEKLHLELPYLKAQVIWAVRQEMASNVEYVLARRTRAILLDAKASIEAAPETARLMGWEFGFGRKWQKAQVEAYRELANGYLIKATDASVFPD